MHFNYMPLEKDFFFFYSQGDLCKCNEVRSYTQNEI